MPDPTTQDSFTAEPSVYNEGTWNIYKGKAIIASVYDDTPDAEKIAKLFATAPELLKALKYLKQVTVDSETEGNEFSTAAANQARDAIDKAEGK